ncbi:MAG TPA: peroxidase family protein, partial [Friedmanniella sp.]
DAFARAWFKLTHRDMGPIQRYVGALVPAEELLWQDRVPAVDHPLVTADDVATLKAQVLASGLGVSRLVATAWASASTYRTSDKRGGANGARVRLQPQSSWEVNEPDELHRALRTLEGVQAAFNGAGGPTQVSLADLIVLAGDAAVEKAAADAGHPVSIPFTPGRTDATQEQTDVESFAPLEPSADGFRNFLGKGDVLPAEYRLVDRANLLGLTAPELTLLVGGLRVLGANASGSSYGVLTDRVGVLSNDFFVNLLAFGTEWRPVEGTPGTYEAVDSDTGAVRWTGTRNDLVFGSSSELRAVAEVYASDDAAATFAADFARAWTKVMMADRWDLTA